MSVQVKPALSAVAFFVAALFSAVLAPNGAHAAGTCLTAPNAAAPQGSHWYYRIERPSLRKCWRLVAKDQKDQRAVARMQPEPDEETAAAPVPAANGPVERQAEPEAAAPAPVIRNLVTRNVSNTNDTAPLQPPEPSTNTVSRADAPVPQGATSPQPPATLDQPVPQPAVASASTEASGQHRAPTWGHLFGAIALLGFLTSAAFLVMHIVRRRTDVMTTVRDAGGAPFETPVAAPAREAPTFAPLPPMALMAREDDIEQALRRRRRAA
jgi:hypothetical protein